jgi:hypothetical protein
MQQNYRLKLFINNTLPLRMAELSPHTTGVRQTAGPLRSAPSCRGK